jgi:beta-glucosidase
MFPNPNLNYDKNIMEKISNYSNKSKLITITDLNRPAILTEVNNLSLGLVGTFGVSDKAILEVLFGNYNPSGKLPFEIPSSMKEVNEQKEDLPDDTKNPVFGYGHGLSYIN